jgi:hypothetical protein
MRAKTEQREVIAGEGESQCGPFDEEAALWR